MIRRPPRSTQSRSSAASDVYKRQTLDHGANITCGRAIALNGAVTMDTNNIDTGNCAGGTGTTPEPGTIALVATGGAMAAGANFSNFSFWGLGASIPAFFRKRKR